MTEHKQMKVTFAPGAFDTFEGTQDELDAFVKELTDLVESGEFLKNSVPVNLDQIEDTDPELHDILTRAINEQDGTQRKLN